MSDEKQIETVETPTENLDLLDTDQTLDFLQDTFDNFLAAADVEAVYGAPVEHGDNLVLPAAEVVSAMGFGVGSGSGGDDEGNGGSGTGGGGGGRVFSRPVAVVISSPEGVRVEPVIDLTKLAIAAVTTLAFMLSFVSRLRDPKKMLKDL